MIVLYQFQQSLTDKVVNMNVKNPVSRLISRTNFIIRIKTDNRIIAFNDRLQGLMSQNLADNGDFILKRKDRIIAYQFAVVIDIFGK